MIYMLHCILFCSFFCLDYMSKNFQLQIELLFLLMIRLWTFVLHDTHMFSMQNTYFASMERKQSKYGFFSSPKLYIIIDVRKLNRIHKFIRDETKSRYQVIDRCFNFMRPVRLLIRFSLAKTKRKIMWFLLTSLYVFVLNFFSLFGAVAEKNVSNTKGAK